MVSLGGGRRRASDAVDPRVGFSDLRPLGSWLRAGEPLLRVHAANADDAGVACQAVLAAITLAERAAPAGPVVMAALLPAAPAR